MKRTLAALLILLAALPALARGEAPQRKLTLMIYMCGSNLESGYGSASADLQEIQTAGFDAAQTTVLVMTGGTTRWATGYDPGETRIMEVGRRSRVVQRNDPVNMGSAAALTQLLRFGIERYPAREYALILWDHGGGPLEGVCWDELFSMDSLSLDELTQALRDAQLPAPLEWIGFDACLMGSAEVAAAMAPYARYMIASQETEPAQGWNYAFLNGIEADESGAETGRRIVDTYFEQTLETPTGLTLACIDLSRIDGIRTALDSFFTPIGQQLDTESFTALSEIRFAAAGFGKAVRGVENQGYDLVDLKDLVRRYSLNASGSRALSAIDAAIVCSRSSIEGASGLSVYHPFSNKAQYLAEWRRNYAALDFSSGYEDYIDKFGSLLTGDAMASWAGLRTEELSAAGEGPLFALQLTPEQQKTLAGVQLVILAAQDQRNGIYGTQSTTLEDAAKGQTQFAPVYRTDALADENGRITAAYAGRALYAVDEEGRPLLGPLSYRLSEDGGVFYIRGFYQDKSGREDFADNLQVLFGASAAEDGDALSIVSVHGFDSATGAFTSRIPVSESAYTNLQFYPETRAMPDALDDLPGFDEWTADKMLRLDADSIRLPCRWSFRFFPDQLSASQLYAAFQITDTQQNTHLSRPIPIVNPNLENVAITPRVLENTDCRFKAYLLKDTSPMDPGLNLVVECTNLSRWTANVIIDHVLLNGVRNACPEETSPIYFSDLPPNETRVQIIHIRAQALTGLDAVTELSADLTVQQVHHDKTESAIRFGVERCSLAGIAPAQPDVIAKTQRDGVVWQLLALSPNQAGDIECLFHVENRSNEPLEGSCHLGANRLLPDSTAYLFLEIQPHSDAYVTMTLESRVELNARMTLNGGRGHSYWLASDHTLPLYGVREITSLQVLIVYGVTIRHSAALQLTEPWPVPAGTADTAPLLKPLLTGELEASAERVLLGDNGVGVRLVLRNAQSQPATVQINRKTVNGQASSTAYGTYVIIPARGTTVCTLFIGADDLPEGEIIREVGFSFRINDQFSTQAARIVLQSPESRKAGYLSPEAYETVPVRSSQPKLTITSPRQQISGICSLTLGGHFENGSTALVNVDQFDLSQTQLELELEVDNQAETRQRFECSAVTVNGTRTTDASWLFSTISPGYGQTRSCRISLDQLRGIREIRELSFDVTCYDPDNSREKTTVACRFEVTGCDLSGLTADLPAPLAEAEDGALRWSLLDARQDPSGQVLLSLRAENASDRPVSADRVQLAANGIWLAQLSQSALQPGMDQCFTVQAVNERRVPQYETEAYNYPYVTGALWFPLETSVIERRSGPALTEVTLCTGRGYERTLAVDRSARLTLSEPLPLTDAAPIDPASRYPLIGGSIAVWVNAILVGDNGIALSLDLVNDTDKLVDLEPYSPALNGVSCRFFASYNHYTLPPHTTRPLSLSIMTQGHEDVFPSGAIIHDVSTAWRTNDGQSLKTAFTLLREAPLGVEGGLVLTGADIYRNVSKAKLLINTTPRMEANAAAATRFTPRLDADRVARFESGTACLMRERPEPYRYLDPANPEADYEFLPVRESLCVMELTRGQDGVVAADYSGLVCVNSLGKPLEYYSFVSPDSPNAYIAALGAGLYDSEEAWRSLDPETSLDDSAYRYVMVAACLVDVTDGTPSIAGYQTQVNDAQGQDAAETAREDERITSAAAEQTVLYLKDGAPLGGYYERIPVVSQYDLRFIGADALAGILYVYYDIHYADGTGENFFEPYIP